LKRSPTLLARRGLAATRLKTKEELERAYEYVQS
jgi:hypothetical protein